MRLGIVADTHDNLVKIKDMIEIINENRIDFLLHAGDYVAPFALSPLDDLKCEWLGVFGNNDGERQGLQEKSAGRIKVPPYFFELDSKKIALMHKFSYQSIKKDNRADIIIFGHSHNPEIKEEEKLIINPGEVCGWLTGKSSLVILDLENLKPEIIYF